MTRILQAAAALLVPLALLLAAPASAVQKKPATCGGFGIPPGSGGCSAGFCQAPAGQCIILTIGGGTCTLVPQTCVGVVKQVCGCDFKTYKNDCARRQARVSKFKDGAC